MAKDEPKEAIPTQSQGGRQVGEATKYGAEPGVWTEPMLAALETGVKGGKWFSLIDKVVGGKTLNIAWQKVRANKGCAGVDHESVGDFEKNAEARLRRISAQLMAGTYEPQAVKRVEIPKGNGKTRPLGIPTVEDRIVQQALRLVIEPIFEREFGEYSYGCRPGRSTKDALRRVAGLLKEGCRYVVDVDAKSYFDTIPHEPLMEQVRAKVADGRVLELIERFLRQNVLSGLRQWSPEQGTPQGAVLSPLLANLYLHPLDKQMQAAGFKMTRYMDDFVVQCESQEEATRAMETVKQWMKTAGLELNSEKTCIVDMSQSEAEFEFLGYRFSRKKGRDYRFPRKKSLQKLRDGIRQLTPRCNGLSFESIIEEVNAKMRGWFNYFKHTYKNIFPEVDGYVRRRLRSILRKRSGRRGGSKGNGADHQRWPNDFFQKRGLFSTVRAHAELCHAS